MWESCGIFRRDSEDFNDSSVSVLIEWFTISPLCRQLRYLGPDFLPVRPLRDLKVVLSLESHPDAGTRAKIAGEAHRRIGGNAAFAPNNLADSQRRNPDVAPPQSQQDRRADKQPLKKRIPVSNLPCDSIFWYTIGP